MKKSLLALLSLVLLLAGSCTKKDEVAITPLPLSCSFGKGEPFRAIKTVMTVM